MKMLYVFFALVMSSTISSAHDEQGSHHHRHHRYVSPMCGNQLCDPSEDLNSHHGHHRTHVCATLYQHAGFGGSQVSFSSGSEVSSLSSLKMNYYSSWNNEATSLVVNPGCALTVYQYNNFGIHYYTGQEIGMHKTYRGLDTIFQLYRLDDRISSLTCHCQ